MKIIIKTMETSEEIEGKSLVHWQTWREAYDDLLPADHGSPHHGNYVDVVSLVKSIQKIH